MRQNGDKITYLQAARSWRVHFEVFAPDRDAAPHHFVVFPAPAPVVVGVAVDCLTNGQRKSERKRKYEVNQTVRACSCGN